MSKKAFSELLKRWVGGGRRPITRAGSPADRTRARLRLEEVEHRVVPATLDPVTASDTRVLGNGFAPAAVTDPTNPNTIVLVNATSGAGLAGRISRDGGQTWQSFGITNGNLFPGGIQLTNANSPSVAFSRTGELYVAWTVTTADFTTAGRLFTSSFTVDPNPASAFDSGVTSLNGPVTLYTWVGQDPVYNPTVAVDNNVDAYTDPQTGVTTPVDTMLGATGSGKAVYVAWNTNARTPTIVGHTTIPPAGVSFTPTAIFVAASKDQGLSYSTPVPVAQNGFFNTFAAGVAPQILFEPGDLNPNTDDAAGALKFVWSNPGGGFARQVTSQPDNGVLTQEVTANYQASGPGVFISEPTVVANSPDSPVVAQSTITVNITDPAFTTLSDINVRLAIFHPNVSQLEIDLVAPNGMRVRLLESRVDGNGADRRGANPPASFAPFGLPAGANLGVGVDAFGNRFFTGTTFDAEAARLIQDGANTAPYIASFRPEGGGPFQFTSLYGLDAATLNGDWTLEIRDFRDDDRNAGNNATQFLNSWSLQMSSLISNSGFGLVDTVDTSGALGTGANLGGSGTGNATAVGMGAGLSVAYDTSLGSFSPHSGRLYAAYTGNGFSRGADIFLIYSDDNGQTWTDGNSGNSINDDDRTDNFTEGNRSQFMPSVTVDPVTGTVVVMWYDGRLDASNARVTTYMATSIDGGDTFSVQDLDAYLNNTKTAVDQLTRTTVTLEPMPANLRAAGATEAGLRQSVLAYGGQIKPFWTGNQNDSAQQIYTATVVTAAGPRVVDGDMGSVTAVAGFSETQSVDVTGTTGSFRLTFNNGTTSATTPLLPFGASAATVRNALNNLASIGPDSTVTVTTVPILGGDRYVIRFATGPLSTRDVLPLTSTGNTGDLTVTVTTVADGRTFNNTFAADGTRQLDGIKITFDRPVDVSTFDPGDVVVLYRAPGTTRDAAVPPTRIPVSAIIPLDPTTPQPGFSDDATTFFVQFATPQSAAGTYSYSVGPNIATRVRSQRAATFTPTDTPTPLPDLSMTDSTIVVPQPALPLVVSPTTRIQVSLDITHTFDSDLRITLYGPNGVSLVLADRIGGGGEDFTNTRFNDAALTTIDDPSNFAPFDDVFRPQGGPLSTFNGTPLAGAWTLRVEDLIGGDVGTLNGWSISFVDGPVVPGVLGTPLTFDQSVAQMDQDADAKTGEVGTTINPNLPLNQQAPRLYTDAFNAPGTVGKDPFNADPFALAVDPNTLPLIVPGPHVTDTSVPQNPTSADNLVLNGTANQLDVTFDRDINPATFTAANILSMTGPAGAITPRVDVTVLGTTGTFSVTVNTGTGNQSTVFLPVGTPANGGTVPTASLQNALAALLNVGTGNVSVIATPISGGGGTVYRVTFTGLLANQPLPTVTAQGVGGATATVQNEVFSVAPVPGSINPATGGTRTFRVTFPTQFLSGPYSIEFGQDPSGNSGRAVDVPRLVSVLTSTSTTLKVTFDQATNAAAIQTAVQRVTGPNGSVSTAGVTATPSLNPNDPANTYVLTFPVGLPAGQYVVDFDPASGLQVAGSGAAVDMNFNAGLDVLRGDDENSQDLSPKTFSTATPVAIAPGDPTNPVVSESRIVVTDDYIIRQSDTQLIQLLMNIQHPDVSDLTIELVPPEATGLAPITLFTGSLAPQAANGANFTNTRLIDRVGDPNVTNIEEAAPPFNPGAGRFFSPQQPLSALVGKSARGVWTLRVTNAGDNTDAGGVTPATVQISDWSLTLPKAVTSQRLSFTSTTSPVIAPGSATSPTTTDSPINVPVDFTIRETDLQQIQLLLNISHPNVRDLDLILVPPAATGVGPITLFTGSQLAPTAGNVSANFTNTRLIDLVGSPSAPSIETARPPFNAGADGYFSPQNPLTALVGKQAIGTWTLRVVNHGANPATSDPNFNPNTPIAIQNWTLSLPRTVVPTGLGEAVADRFSAGFRIFTQDPTNDLTQQAWTPVGPGPTNETANSARVSTVAVDPSDPTGNTVYVAVAGGGVWKTTNFLTTDKDPATGLPLGPHYVPLTDFGPTSGVNVSSLALFPRNNDPNQTIVFALTGEPHSSGVYFGLTSSGVGVLRSMDGGRTWQVLDSRTNVTSTGAVAKIADPVRDHVFVGTTGYKIVADPTAGKDGGVILYMAVSGGATPGLWRSLDTGNTWALVMAGNATDVTLAAGSANPTDPVSGATVFQGNLQTLYASFSSTPVGTGPGIYKTNSAPAAASLTFMPGGTANPLIRDITFGSPGVELVTAAPVTSPNGAKGRVALAVPYSTGNALTDSYLKDWLYVLESDGLYVTKDAGAHWTRVRIPNNTTVNFTSPINGTNNESDLPLSPAPAPNGRAQVNVGAFQDTIAITVDPQNPNIVYITGFGSNSVRLDLSYIRDAHNFTFYNNSDADVGGSPATSTEVNANSGTIGGVRPAIPVAPNAPIPGHGAVMVGGSNFDVYEDANGDPIDFINLFHDYNQPFTSNSLVRVTDTQTPLGPGVGTFVNDGKDIRWNPFEDIFDQNGLPDAPEDPSGSARLQNRFSATNTHSIIPVIDPVTHKTRLLYATDEGLFTGVDAGDLRGTGTLAAGIGFNTALSGNRNGNLQVSQFYNGAVQPSQLAADLAGALFYGMGDGSGFPVSSPDVLTTGNLNWRGPLGEGVAVLTDQTGTGTTYQYRGTPGFDLNTTATSLDFFRVLFNTQLQSFGGGTSRVGQSSGSLLDNGEFWSSASLIQPAVNPLNPNVLMIGSISGRVYRTTDLGQSWQVVAQAGDVGAGQVNVVAFGSSDPAKPNLTNSFLYAGTQGGQIFSTTTGGAPWTNISAGLDGLQVLRIVPNPQVGKKDVFAITSGGVFYKADGTVPGAWTNITGNLFNLTRSVFGDVTDQTAALLPNSLTALAVDWRYAIPSPTVPGATFPVLYVAGDGGVFRSGDFGQSWQFFPSVSGDGAAVEGGYLPNTHITDLDLSIGDIDPTTGKNKAGGLNMLVATTYGRGTFAIRLDTALPPEGFISGPYVTQLINPNPIGGPSDRLQVKFSGPVDPATFTTQDVQLIGPGNVAVPITSVTMISVPDANGFNPRNLFEIQFQQQTAASTAYQLIVGANPATNVPLISDPSGFVMNQDQDSVNGEALVDQYRTTVILNSTTTSSLVVTAYPTTTVAGQPEQVTIQAQDANGVLIPVDGTLTLSGAGVFSPTSVPITGGVASFTITFETAGNQQVDVAYTDTVPPATTTVNGTSWTTVVSAAAATQLVITPTSQVVTSPATLSFTLTAQDQFGNVDPTYNQTVALATSGAPATLDTDTVTLTNGVGSFNGDFQTTGTVQIAATGPDPVNPSNTLSGTATVLVNPGPATQLVVVVSGGPFVIGEAVPVTVRALDAAGNQAVVNGPVTIGVTPGGSSTLTPAAPVFVNGEASFTVTFSAAGSYTITATRGALTASGGPVTISETPPPPSPTTKLTGQFAVGTGMGGSPVVGVFANGAPLTSVEPFPAGFHNEVFTGGFRGGNRVAVADVTGDGVPDYVVGTGPTITAAVVVVDGATGQTVLDYTPFDDFQGGVFVAVGDITGDGVADIVITPDEGGGPRVVILQGGGSYTRIGNFFGIDDPNFRGGARAGVGDLNGDGFADLVVSAGFGGGPRLSVYDGRALAQGRQFHPVGDFFMFEPELRNGAFVAVGDVDGDGFGDIIGAAGPGGAPRVMAISGKTFLSLGPTAALASPIVNFFAGDPDNRGGVRVATKNLDGDRFTDLIVGSGDTGGSRVTAYAGNSLAAGGTDVLFDFDALPGYTGGVFVG